MVVNGNSCSHITGGVAGMLVLTVLAIAGYFLFRGDTSGKIDSIAVMPFVNEGGDPETGYLSDGMTGTLIGSLSRLPDLNVKSRSSVFRYKDKPDPDLEAPFLLL